MAEKRIATERLLSDAYMANSQRRVANDGGIRDRYIGQIRFDSLFSRTLVIPDTHFVDGRFFVDIDPVDLVDLVGRGVRDRQLPIEVRTRSSALTVSNRLAGSIAGLLLREDSNNLSSFPFNTIADPTARIALAESLSKVPNTLLRDRLARASTGNEVAVIVGGLLRELLGPSSADVDLERLEAGWRRWILAESDGSLVTVPWTGSADVANLLLHERPLVASQLLTDSGRHVFSEIAALLPISDRRADVVRLLESVRPNYGWRYDADLINPDAEARDLRTIDRWFSLGRYAAMARQHDADLAYVFDSASDPLSLGEKLLQVVGYQKVDADVLLADDILPSLSLMSGEEFGRFTHMVRGHLRSAWSNGSPDSIKAILDELNGWIEQLSLPSAVHRRKFDWFTRVGLVVGPFLALSAAAVAGGHTLATIVSASAAAGTATAAVGLDMLKSRTGSGVQRRIIEYMRRRSQ